MGEGFTDAADAYVRRFLQKGIPSLFTDLKSLYVDTAKAEVSGQCLYYLCFRLDLHAMHI